MTLETIASNASRSVCPKCLRHWYSAGPDGFTCDRDGFFPRGPQQSPKPAAIAAPPAPTPVRRLTPVSQEPVPFPATGLSELLSAEDEPLDVVIGDTGEGAILTVDGKGMIVGPTGIGKTNLLLRMGRALCEASPFLGLQVPKPRRVLHVALEGSPAALKRRLRKVWAGTDEEARGRFFIAHLQLSLASDVDLARLDQLLYRVRPEVLILDPLRNAHPWDENKSDEMAQLTAILDGIIIRHKCAPVLAHHDRKRPPFAKFDAGTDRVRGSTALTGWLSFCASIDADVTQDRMVIHWTKTRDAEDLVESVVVDFDRETLDFVVNDEGAVGGKVPDAAILNAVFQAGRDGIRGTELIAGFVQGAGASERWIRQRVRALVTDQKLVEDVPPNEKKGAKWYRIPDDREGQ